MNGYEWSLRTSAVAVCLVLTGLVAAGETARAEGEGIPIDKPGVLDQPGATYLLTTDVTAPRTAFMVKGDGITLDLGGHTVTYGTEVGVDYCHGVFLRPGGGEESFWGVPKEGFGGGQWGINVASEGDTGHLAEVHHNFCRVVAEEGFGDADPLDFDCPRYSCNRVYNWTVIKAVITGPKKATINTIVQLDASQSKEPRRFPPEVIRYQWRQTGGPAVDLSSTEWVSPIFFSEEPGTYAFELTVSSPIAAGKPTSFTVEVVESRRP